MLHAMVRLSFVTVSLLALLIRTGDVSAIEWWHDPDRGCGLIGNWKNTNQIADLPGCDGDLPNGAPPGEIAMHDAKRLLHEAEKQIDTDQIGNAEQKIAQAIEIMNRAPSDPRVNWARSHFQRAIQVLKSKIILAPMVAKLRLSHETVIDLAAQPKPDIKALGDAVRACLSAFQQVEFEGVDLTILYELTAGKIRPLRQNLQECEEAQAKNGAAKPRDTVSKP